ncbi:MAG: aspartate-semialdehyde dehydrogenase [Bacteroidales bacterium]|jgi:aspartate-semialdehyde dehydrogenase|nr:aspartate-semialdehyde dehydrogenase [Bacteroidales bacterium]
MKVAVVGATGMVGRSMLRVLEERNFPVTDLIVAASSRSVGKEIIFRGKPCKVLSVMEAVEERPAFAIFSAGAAVSKEWAPVFAAVGTVVIDNSSAWRMEEGIPLVVPEINAGVIRAEDRIIANPNCSTIQMLMALAPLHKAYRIKRVVVSTYQSVTGTGIRAVTQLENESKGIEGERAYPHPIHRNCLPHCDLFLENGYTKEEMKLVNETKKILDDNSVQVTATAVRVPVVGGHSEAVNVEFENEFELGEVRRLLDEFPGVVVHDSPEQNLYPMPVTAHNHDEVFVGRIRRDFTREKCLNIWVVADNIRKGAATNAIQIAEYMLRAGHVK